MANTNTVVYADVFNFLSEPWTEVTPMPANSWVDVDVSSYIPAGATGVILKVRNTNGGGLAFGVRKNGSTDNRTNNIFWASHSYVFIGVDSSRIFECYVGNITSIDVWLVGYTLDGVTFLTNATDISLTGTGTWTDIDITSSTTPDVAIGAIIEVTGDAAWGLRKNGSTDDRSSGFCCGATGHVWFIVGVDSGEICEGTIGSLNQDFFLVGYVTKGATFLTNATAYSENTTTGSYVDVDITADSNGQATGAFVEVTGDGGGPWSDYALRWNGSSEDVYDSNGHHNFAFVQVDSGEVFEQKIETANVDIFLIGWSNKTNSVLLNNAQISNAQILR